ncbi:ribosome recycling factor [Ferrovibrio sp.]|uniref:ribosome recycling factor n=1 Tax=Ferrovibrio sp. TaxID=1917215 RepID=UPI0035139CE4
MAEPDIDDIERRMNKAVDVLKHEFSGLRTGRASTSMLDPVRVEVYGSMMPINQVGTVSVPEPRMISVQVWDKSNVKAVEKAITASGLGLNPQADGQLIRIPIPELNEQRRKELTKVAGQYAEQARVAVRGVRRDGMDSLKKMEKDGDLGEDDAKMWHDEIQALTDASTKKIDELLAQKTKEILQV